MQRRLQSLSQEFGVAMEVLKRPPRPEVDPNQMQEIKRVEEGFEERVRRWQAHASVPPESTVPVDPEDSLCDLSLYTDLELTRAAVKAQKRKRAA